MAKQIIIASRDSKWHDQHDHLPLKELNFVKGQKLEVGVDVPAHIAADMLRCGYAEDKDAQAKVSDADKAKAEAAIEAAKKALEEAEQALENADKKDKPEAAKAVAVANKDLKALLEAAKAFNPVKETK
jgi:hypothetical protein